MVGTCLQFIDLDILHISRSSVLAFIEFLCFNNLSLHSILAYLSSIKSKFKALSLPLSPFTHHSMALALRSIALNVPKGIFDIQSPSSIIYSCSSLPLGPIYKALFLTAFFAFFRLSNLVPSSASSYAGLTLFPTMILQPSLLSGQKLSRNSASSPLFRSQFSFHPLFALFLLSNL